MNEERKNTESKVRKQVNIQLTAEQEFGLSIVKNRTGLDYNNLARLAISYYIDKTLTNEEKDLVKYSIPEEPAFGMDYME